MKRMLAYYRASLADAQIMAPDIRHAVEVSHAEIVGRIGNAREFIRKFHERDKEDRQAKDKPPSVWPVTIVYLRGALPVVHGYMPQKAKPILCISATLQEDGRLVPSLDSTPWIPRDLLGSGSGVVTDVVGDLADADVYYTGKPFEASSITSMEDAVAWATGLLSHVVAAPISAASKMVEPFALAEGALIVDASEVVGGTVRQLVALMDHALKAEIDVPLARRMTQVRAQDPVALPVRTFWQAAGAQGGTMSAEHPLSPTQREAMHHFVATGDGEVVAVNGPPGTGKTTLLQSIVAQLLVERAARPGRPEMPLVVATSANNQAVTNVIDSFGKVFDPAATDLWSQRWVPGVPSYGCFAASDGKAQAAAEKGYLVVEVSFEKGKPLKGYFAHLENEQWQRTATAQYLSSASDALGTTFRKVGEAVNALQAELVRTLDASRRLLAECTAAVDADADMTLEASVARQKAPLEAARNAAVASVQTATGRHRFLKNAIGAWDIRQKEEPWWFTWLAFMPGVKARHSAWLESFFVAQGWQGWPAGLPRPTEAGFQGAAITSFLAAGLQRVAQQGRAAQQKGEKAAAAIEGLHKQLEHFDERFAGPDLAVAGKEPLMSSGATLRTVSERLDVTLRARAFRIAARYWEGRCLLELEEKLAAGSGAYDTKAPARLERMLRRIAMLTPCMVSTIYSLPKFYRAFSEGAATYLLNSIDLLVVDEAGQVSPETGFGPFLLARKALVVGDTAQIEPVWSVPPRIDSDNARAAGVLPADGDYERWSMGRGCAAADGSLMRMAQLACPWRVSVKPRLPDGLMLLEHRRCDPAIIGYCNEVLYEGQLVPCRPAVTNRILPAMGYANIQTPARKQGQSWVNEGEARVIAAWIAERREALEAHYDKPIAQIVGVVTPFRPQRDSLLRALGKALGSGHGITVGTVHALQGAERDVVLFSPTYGEGFDGTPFFDRSPNMLNVAVSRARDSFLVFGNMAIFNVLKRSPVGLLGQHLFRDAANEIVDIDPKVASRFARERGTVNDTDVLSGGGAHLAHLHECLRSVPTDTHIIIASPYVTAYALETSATPLKDAVTRGVQVSVYFHWHMTSERNGFNSALQTLRDCGVHLYSNRGAKRQFHNKTLAVGDQELVEGSYNWLSAVRDEHHRLHRHERSLRIAGQGLAETISAFRREMDSLCKPV